jgi:hypothetical protein
MDPNNEAAMSDAALEAALLGGDDTADEAAEPAEQTTVTDAEGAPDAEPPADQQEQQADEQQQQTDEFNPAGPGDLKVALRQTRDELKALKAEADELRQWRQQQAQAQAQAQYQADEQARLQQRNAMLDDVFDPEQRAQLLQQFAREDQYFAQQQAQQALVQVRYQDGFAMAREAYPDFDAVLNKAIADPEQAALLEAVSQQALAQGRNPVIAAYQMAKKLDPDAQKAQIAAEVAKQVQAVLQKNQPPQSKGHTTIGHAAGSAPSGPAAKAPHQMNDDELEAALKI